MKERYPYFKDPRALAEIRKHKWIESQKAGREIGFATAAVDWIKKYGEEWKRIHVKEDIDKTLFLERRGYRRFKLNCMVELIKNNIFFQAEAINLSIFGLTCRATEYFPLGSQINARLVCEHNKESLICSGIIDRLFTIYPRKYELFLRFDEHAQQEIEKWDYIRKNIRI